MALVDQFLTFHRENPGVYAELVRLADAARERGASKLGMKQLFEVLRWETSLRTRDWTGFKLNNNYTAFYARLMMHRERVLAGMFDVRRQEAEFDPSILDPGGAGDGRLFT